VAGNCDGDRSRLSEDHIWLQIDEFFCERPDPAGVTAAPPKFDPEICSFNPP
jgi:hypothetical protein